MKTIFYDALLKKDSERILESAPEEIEDDISELIEENPKFAALAYILGEPVGIIASDASAKSPRASVSVFVSEKHRRRGVGSALVSLLTEKIFSIGVKQILFDFIETDSVSKAFAEKNGFRYAFSSLYMRLDGETPDFVDNFEKYDDSMYEKYHDGMSKAFYPLRKKIGNEPAMMPPSENVRAFLRDNPSNVMILTEKGEIIAGGCVDGDCIEDIFVDERFRKKGLGKKLISKGVSIIRKNKNIPVHLWVVEENVCAVSLYKSMNFIIEKKHMFYRVTDLSK